MIRPAAAVGLRRNRTLGRRWLAAAGATLFGVGTAGLSWDAAAGETGRWRPVTQNAGSANAAAGLRVEPLTSYPEESDPFAAVRDPFAAVRTVSTERTASAVEAVRPAVMAEPAPEPSAAEEPIAAEPAVADWAGSELVAAAPAAAEPAVAEPAVAEQVAAQQIVAEPVVAEPVVAAEAPAALAWWGEQAAAPEAILRAAEPPTDLEWWQARRAAAELGWWIVPRPGMNLGGGDQLAQGGGLPGATPGNTGGAGVGVGGGGIGSPLGGGGGLGSGGLGSGGLGSGGLGGAGSDNLGPFQSPLGGGSAGTRGGIGSTPGFGSDQPLGPLRRDDLRPQTPGGTPGLPPYGPSDSGGLGPNERFPQGAPGGSGGGGPIDAKNPFAALPVGRLKPLSSIQAGLENPPSKLSQPAASPAKDFFGQFPVVYVAPQSWPNHTPLAMDFQFRCRPLWFEDANLERCGYTHGCLQPLVSGVYFFSSVPFVPYVFAAQPQCITVPTKPFCPPGCQYSFRDNYLPPPSAVGAVTEAAAIAGLVLLIP